jgi:hypothetical protein
MGVPALLIALGGLVKGFGRRDEYPPSMTAAGGMSSGGGMSGISAGLDQARAAQGLSSRLPWGSPPPGAGGGSGTSGQIAKLERLQRLRESGTLTDAEFEWEKAKVLAES